MSSKAIIHYRNQPFMAVVDDKGPDPVECTPVVYDDFADCGVGVIYPDGSASIWGPASPRDLIAAWRGTEVLRCLDRIEFDTLAAAYHTGMRDPRESDMKDYVLPTIAKIGGRTVYEEIMSMPVPEEIIRGIVDGQSDDSHLAPSTYPLTDEVRAGTVQWRQEFADAGIENPVDVDARQAARDALIASYSEQLDSLAKWRNLPRECLGMWSVESGLIDLVGKGLAEHYDSDMVVAVAAIYSQLGTSAFMGFLMPAIGPGSQEEFDRYMEETKQKAVKSFARWVISRRPKRSWRSCRRRSQPNLFSLEEVKQRLAQLVDDYFPTNNPEPAS